MSRFWFAETFCARALRPVTAPRRPCSPTRGSLGVSAVERRLGREGCGFLEVLDSFTMRGACHRRRLGVLPRSDARPATRLSGDGRPDGTVEDAGPEASKLGPVRGTTSRQPAESSGRRDHCVSPFVRFVYLHVIWFVLWLKVEPFKDVFP
jgi:hypothetical protein